MSNFGVALTTEDMLQCFDEAYKRDEGVSVTPAYFIFVEYFPYNMNGKKDSKALKQIAINELKLKDTDPGH